MGIKSKILGGVWVLAPGLALAAPEGTRQLGLTQGLEGGAIVQVFAQEGETIRFCSSDNGVREADVVVNGDTFAIDRDPGDPNPIPANRLGAEVLLSPPTDTFCRNNGECDGALRCRSIQDGSAFDGNQALGRCSYVFAVNNNAGYCNAAQPVGQRNWLSHASNETGNWRFNFVGEPETLTNSGRSTRFFEVDVALQNGAPAPNGRLNSPYWRLNAHSFAYGTDADFYAVAPVGDGARVFVIDVDNLRGFRFGLVANTLGITRHPRQSWCLFGDPTNGRRCVPEGSVENPVNSRRSQYNIFLAYPDPAPAPAPSPRLQNVRFNDEAGTRTITPDGDGIQDSGAFQFESNTNATYEIIIDTNDDGVLDPLVDRVLRGDAVEGENQVVWDGNDRDGNRVPPGGYAFDVRLSTAETHFPMDDIENNSDGFVIFEQLNRNERVAVPMFWDDTAIRIDDELIDLDDVLQNLGTGSRNEPIQQRRRWTQYRDADDNDVPLIFDTWVVGEEASVDRATCDQCGDDTFDEIIVEEDDEIQDSDGDGIPDNVEDSNGNGQLDPGETDPNNPDTDGDGIGDGVEDANQNGNQDPGETDPADADSDDDGLDDGVEDSNQNGNQDNGETNPLNPDTDGDGLEDGTEDADRDGDFDQGEETDPLNPDTDNDGLEDGEEDANGNGQVEGDETDPKNPDTDGDGLTDGIEVEGANPTNPLNPDTDRDGLTDGQEDADADGEVDVGMETDPNDPDTDDGGEFDGSEVAGGRDPINNPNDDVVDETDTDGDGLSDQQEDPNGNGIVDEGETDPNNEDTDGDGLSDGIEVLGDNPTNPTNPDTDGDGVRDGVEDTNQNGAFDNGEIDPNNSDTDGDGLTDGQEDSNNNGVWGADDMDNPETDPRIADTDRDGLDDGTEVNGENQTDPLDPDSDDDGLPDGTEDADGDGSYDVGVETNPNDPDTDDGGEPDGSEVDNGRNPIDDPSDDMRLDSDGDGIDDLTEIAGCTDPEDPDTDNDGLDDGVEDADVDGEQDPGETDPCNDDSDGDGILDGVEDANGNGILDDGESNPLDDDTDDDGLNDGIEDRNRDGNVDDDETDPANPDTDGDGLNDGLEDENGDGIWDDNGAEGETDPRNRDTDGDGLADNVEDANGNGVWDRDEGETDPRVADTDGDGINDDEDPDPLDGLDDGTDPTGPGGFVDGTVTGAGIQDCAAAPGQGDAPWLALLLGAGLLMRRRRR